MEGKIPSSTNDAMITSTADVNKILIGIANIALSESSDVKFSRHTFDMHKNSDTAQESHLIKGDVFEIMTNTLTYDLDHLTLGMIAKSLFNDVIYNYYIEKNSLTSNCIYKLVFAFYMQICEMCMGDKNQAMEKLKNNLHIYWIERGEFIYNFSLFNRPGTTDLDHCTFYFIKNKKIIYEALLETVPNVVNDLKSVFTYFRRTSELDLSTIIDTTSVG